MTVNEFVEECRREWRRLGVSDPIANEMAADLTADIEEAESEGGSAEDVLGNSAFDPRRFAGSWAVARGVTEPPAPPTVMSPNRRWPALAFGLLGCLALLALAAAVLVGGRQSAASAVSVSRFAGAPKSVRVFPGSPIVLQHFDHFPGIALFALLLLVLGIAGIGLAIFYGFRWGGGRIGPWEIRRYRARADSSGT
jgi:hypothetical protein